MGSGDFGLLFTLDDAASRGFEAGEILSNALPLSGPASHPPRPGTRSRVDVFDDAKTISSHPMTEGATPSGGANGGCALAGIP